MFLSFTTPAVQYYIKKQETLLLSVLKQNHTLLAIRFQPEMINSKQEQLDALILCEQLVQSTSVVRHNQTIFWSTSTLHAKV